MDLTIKELKEIIKDMPDDARVYARDRDCSVLQMVHVIGCGERPATVIKDKDLRYVETPDDMYGGEMIKEDGVTQAIVFCDCD